MACLAIPPARDKKVNTHMKTLNSELRTLNSERVGMAVSFRVLSFAVSLLLTHSFAAESPALLQARQALAENIPQVAVVKMKAALAAKDFPVDQRIAALRLLAEAQLAGGQAEDALATLQPLADSPEVALLRAHSHASLGRWAEALALYQKLARHPVAAAVGEAESLQALGRTSEAVAVLQQLAAGEGGTPAIRLRLASLLVELGQAEPARAALASFAEAGPADAKWRDSIEARILLLENKPALALEKLEGLGEGASDHLIAAIKLTEAEARLKLADPDAAEPVLENFIRQNPMNTQLPLLFRRLDQIYAMDKTPNENVLRTFVREMTGEAKVLSLFYICRQRIRDQRDEPAQRSLDSFLQENADHPLAANIHQMRADLALARGDLAKAEAEMDAAANAAKSEEARAEFAMRTALINLRQEEYLRAATHLATARRSPRLAQSAAYNTALAWLMQRNFSNFATAVAELRDPELRESLRIEEGLALARAGDARAPQVLHAFLREYPGNSRRTEAQLAYAELAFQNGKTSDAEAFVQAAADTAPTAELAEQSEYLALFLEDAKKPRNGDRVLALAREFLRKHAESALVPAVRMKLGQVYFQHEDFLQAQEQFETLAREQPAGDYAETALFLAGQCSARLINDDSLNRATELFGKVADRHGSLEAEARLQQAIIKNKLGAPDEAVKIYDSILSSPTLSVAEVRYAALIGKGDNLAALGKTDAKQLAAALVAYDALLALPAVPAAWRNEGAYKKGKVLLALSRSDEALTVFYDILNADARENFWSTKAGTAAASLLESRQQWKNAIGVYEKMAKLPGPQSEQARQRIKALKLEHRLWD